MDNMTLVMVTAFIIAGFFVVLILNIIQSSKNKKIKRQIEKLEVEKNVIDSTPIMPELAKIESFLKNEKLEAMYNDWKDRFSTIKTTQIPKLTDMILDADYSLSKMNYKDALYKIAKLEMELYKVRANSDFLLNEIKEITTSEERNRTIITNLKSKYRDLYQKFSEIKTDCGEVGVTIEIQFENIAKKFDVFEVAMTNNEYTEVTQIIKAIDEMLKHMEVVLEEVPNILLLSQDILPKKIEDIKKIYTRMVNEGYPLDYLNVEYNIDEANKKMVDILDRAKILNLEDSLFELKVLLEYFESLYGDFDLEKANKKEYEEINHTFKVKLNRINDLLGDIFRQIEDIKKLYNLSKEDLVLLEEVRGQLETLNSDYKLLIGHTGNNAFAFSKLTEEIKNLMARLNSIEDRLENSLDAIGNMREDESRAHQQLEEIKNILKDAKVKIRDYNLPIIPKNYYVELEEANAAIKEIVKELNNKPITINVLNTRVDTARDLTLKLYQTTKDIIKEAKMAEMAIVYGNRYRTSMEDLDKNLTGSELLFYKGEYHKSLEITINALNKIEPGIYEKINGFMKSNM